MTSDSSLTDSLKATALTATMNTPAETNVTDAGDSWNPPHFTNPTASSATTNQSSKKPNTGTLTSQNSQIPLCKFLEENQQISSNAKNFSLNWIKEGLKPRAVTRDVEWGIPAPFPGAEGKTVYVWIEAVLGYISATIEQCQRMGQPDLWREFWFNKNAKTLYFVGKDNIPFHTIILPALLLASGEDYNLPWNVSATEFLQFKGEKASKSRKIGIWIDEALEMFPVDYWRFFLIATRPETKDTDFTWDGFIGKINADLNDTYGNFIHRTLTFVNCKI